MPLESPATSYREMPRDIRGRRAGAPFLRAVRCIFVMSRAYATLSPSATLAAASRRQIIPRARPWLLTRYEAPLCYKSMLMMMMRYSFLWPLPLRWGKQRGGGGGEGMRGGGGSLLMLLLLLCWETAANGGRRGALLSRVL